jgi:hypothetical protein
MALNFSQFTKYVFKIFIKAGIAYCTLSSLCVQGGGGGWEIRYHIADYAEKIKMAE